MSEIRHISYDSTYLNKQMALAVYLPDEYKYGSKFPVLYFLHGRSGDESFIEQLGLAQLTDSLIAASKIEPMIIVCPRMDNSRGLNSAKIARQEKIGNNVIDVGRYEDYFRFLSVRLNRLKNKLLANYLRNRGNDLATVRNSAFCVAILSNNSFICKYNIFFRKYELSVAIL